jgi:hypothetical protein
MHGPGPAALPGGVPVLAKALSGLNAATVVPHWICIIVYCIQVQAVIRDP